MSTYDFCLPGVPADDEPPANLGGNTLGSPNFRYVNALVPSSDPPWGWYFGLVNIEAMVCSLKWKFPYGRGDFSVLPSAESVKSEFRFYNKDVN